MLGAMALDCGAASVETEDEDYPITIPALL
jgi:hypothetical protein